MFKYNVNFFYVVLYFIEKLDKIFVMKDKIVCLFY